MNTTLTGATPTDFAAIMPGWSEEAYLAYLNSPTNRSADRLLRQAERLKAALRRHLQKHRLTDVEAIAAAGVAVPPKLAERGSNKALLIPSDEGRAV